MNAIFKSLAKSKGEIVCLMDADDFLKKIKLKRLLISLIPIKIRKSYLIDQSIISIEVKFLKVI